MNSSNELLERASNGDVDAQVKLGWEYDQKGHLEEAFQWYQRAADQGYAVGQFNAAEMLRDGAGCPEDKPKAVEYYLSAAKQGYPKAQYCVGIMYATGEGTSQDLYQAYIWLALSAEANADGGDQARDLIAKNMSTELLDQAKTKVSEILSRINSRKHTN